MHGDPSLLVGREDSKEKPSVPRANKRESKVSRHVHVNMRECTSLQPVLSQTALAAKRCSADDLANMCVSMHTTKTKFCINLGASDEHGLVKQRD